MIVIRFFIGVTVAVALIAMTGSFQDSYRRTVNKCDRLCESQRQFPKIKISIGLPMYDCSCYGSRMPDNYLRKN